MPAYILVRRLPTGEIKAHTSPFDTFVRAARAAGMTLYDNRQATKAAAQKFSALLAGTPLGEIVAHDASGYTFRILRADFTVNGVPITPSLAVTDYDRRPRVVEETQFMDEGSLMPGGEYFDHWYYVRDEGSTRQEKRFNGERMITR